MSEDSTQPHTVAGESVRLESDGPVRIITLTAAHRRNALDRPMLDQLQQHVEAVAADPQARCLLVRAEGPTFCAGADLAGLFGDRSRPVEALREDLLAVYASFLRIRDLTIPTIAAVQGAAVGAGLNIALACDIIVAGSDAQSRRRSPPSAYTQAVAARGC